jgi:hypothetical protein
MPSFKTRSTCPCPSCARNQRRGSSIDGPSPVATGHFYRKKRSILDSGSLLLRPTSSCQGPHRTKRGMPARASRTGRDYNVGGNATVFPSNYSILRSNEGLLKRREAEKEVVPKPHQSRREKALSTRKDTYSFSQAIQLLFTAIWQQKDSTVEQFHSRGLDYCSIGLFLVLIRLLVPYDDKD